MTPTAPRSTAARSIPSAAYRLDANEDSFTVIDGLIKQYGDIVEVPGLAPRADGYLINDPDLIRHVLVKNHKAYHKGVGFDRVKMLLGNGIIVSDGEFWLRQRKLIQPAFHRDVIRRQTDTVIRLNEALLAGWEQLADKKMSINITEHTSALTLETVLRAIFSDDLDRMREAHGSNPFAILADDSTRDLRMAVKVRELRALVLELIHERRTRVAQPEDYLSVLLGGVIKQSGYKMDDKTILDEIFTLIIAGHETTASTLNWMWYLLSRHPQVEEQIYEEVSNVCQGRPLEFTQLSRLAFSKSVLEETLRLYPPVWFFTRRAIQKDSLTGRVVEVGHNIYISPYHVHRISVHWPRPEQFSPERFDADAVASRHGQAYIPFGAGPRKCIGEFFAFTELLTHLAMAIPRFRVQLPATDIDCAFGVNLRSKQDIYIDLAKR